MSALTHGRRHAARLLSALMAAALSLLLFAPAESAQAASPAVGALAVKIAATQKNKPYRFGARGPSAFDCSGLTQYVWGTRLKRKLPRTAQQQYKATAHIRKAQVRPGDLVFIYSGSVRNIYHVGIYAGRGRMWHSPKPGSRVKLAPIWTTSWVAGRVR